jgi:hypothetical protein
MLIGYARVSTDEEHLQRHPDRGIRLLLGLIAASLLLPPNQVVSKRMVEKQQMQWSEVGAHHLLQVRTKALNDELRETFVRWYPGMRADPETNLAKKAA